LGMKQAKVSDSPSNRHAGPLVYSIDRQTDFKNAGGTTSPAPSPPSNTVLDNS
jgi:hypothetical protein